MTREELFKNIKNVNEGDILPAFDSLMAFFNLYNVIGIYNNVEITKCDDELANFDIVIQEGQNIDDSVFKINGLNIMIYGIKWHVDCKKVNDHTIHISLLL